MTHSRAPFRHRRRILWGENDPAGMVFTPRFLDFCFEAMQFFWSDVLGINWHEMIFEQQIGAPMVHIDIDFLGPLRTGDPLEIEVRVHKLGRSTIHYGFTGFGASGEEKFRATIVSSMVDNVAVKSVPIPDTTRERLEAYMGACSAA